MHFKGFLFCFLRIVKQNNTPPPKVPLESSAAESTVTVSSTETDPDSVPFSNTEKHLMMRECSQSNIKWKKGIEREIINSIM